MEKKRKKYKETFLAKSTLALHEEKAQLVSQCHLRAAIHFVVVDVWKHCYRSRPTNS